MSIPLPSLLGALACTLAFAGSVRAAEAAAPQLPPEPEVRHIVQEDEHVRIEELRVRGQTQRVVVQPKAPGSRPYEIVTGGPGRNLASPDDAHRGAVGQRVWSVLDF